jgi:hypothetical protein
LPGANPKQDLNGGGDTPEHTKDKNDAKKKIDMPKPCKRNDDRRNVIGLFGGVVCGINARVQNGTPTSDEDVIRQIVAHTPISFS